MKKYKFQILSDINILVVGMVLLSGCFKESEYEKQQKESDLKIKTYLQNNNIEAKKPTMAFIIKCSQPMNPAHHQSQVKS